MKITQAVILAAGLGTRMGQASARTPKALSKLAGRPLIDHVIMTLRASDIETIIVNVHAHAEILIRHLKKIAPDILISDERHQLMGTGGGVAQAFSLLRPEAFFTHNCDSIFPDKMSDPKDILKNMAQKFDSKKMDALLLLAPCSAGGGDFFLQADGRALRGEKGAKENYIYTGVQILSPALMEHPPRGAFDMNVFWQRAARQQKLFGHNLSRPWLHVGTQASLQEAEKKTEDIFSPRSRQAMSKFNP